jgi:hypothetical protein
MLKLTDLIRLAGVSLDDFKIHCATGVKNPPLDAFFAGNWKEWQEHQNQKNFECRQIVSLIHLGGARWLFAGVFDVLGVREGAKHNPTGYTYSTREVSGLDHLTGRAVVEFDKSFRASYLKGPKYADAMLVVAIRDQRMTVGDFPGFKSVLLPLSLLRTIVREKNPTWHSALSNVGGVYVITDNSTGKQYVGSAYGGVGLWNRWVSYAKSGHGGNVELRQLLAGKGEDHAEHFQFSILEVCDRDASDDFVIGREAHWKTVLRTREYGLNAN